MLPLFLLIAGLVMWDPFKVLKEYDNYYDSRIVLNRESVCFKLFEKNYPEYRYDSFVFGSSRSLAFLIEDWKEYLNPQASGFHFDASGEGLYGICKKLEYLDEQGVRINNALVILDADLLQVLQNRSGHLFITPPQFSKESGIDYYMEFLKASLSLEFLGANLDFKIRGYQPYMRNVLSEYQDSGNMITGDYYKKQEELIVEDADYYYNVLCKDMFYERTDIKELDIPVTDLEKEYLKTMSAIFEKHDTDYYIIISPLYAQNELPQNQKELLESYFDANRIKDYSGINSFTENKENYYETSHYRPHVAKQIMEEIYGK